MSKDDERMESAYWETRVFRNTFTYRGRTREVPGWCMKVQFDGRRRTIRLSARDRMVAAREAAKLYRALRDGGWRGVDRERARLGGALDGETAGGVVLDGLAGVPRLAPRKYVSSLHPGFERELFAEVTWEGVTEFLALGTEEPNEGALRAHDLTNELRRGGWGLIHLTHSREATVALFWQANPMTCTYTTLLTHPARSGGGRAPAALLRGWRVLVIEPDGGIRRALALWLSQGPGVARVTGVPLASEVRLEGDWDLILANRDQSVGVRRAWEVAGERDAARPRLLTFGIFADSDAIFASFSGVGKGYVLRRVPPAQLLSPLLSGYPDGPARAGRTEEDRYVRRHFQAMFAESEPVAVPPPAEFTARELEILDLLARGFADKEIGQDLGISAWTVHTHLKRIFAKYGVRTRTEAVVRHLQK